MSRTTDWTKYYSKRSRIASFTRNYVQGILIDRIKTLCSEHPRIYEAGGANSCFFQAIYEQVSPRQYTVLDNNDFGLKLFVNQYGSLNNVSAVNLDIAAEAICFEELSDLTFSAGLIEHFAPAGTAGVIENHFKITAPGGIVLLTFPTPTRKYTRTRKVMELLHVWQFHDERPLLPEEALQTALSFGELLENTLLDKMPLTQQLMIFRKSPGHNEREEKQA